MIAHQAPGVTDINLPQEAPAAFADAVLDVGEMRT
jgi:hypothetical protein